MFGVFTLGERGTWGDISRQSMRGGAEGGGGKIGKESRLSPVINGGESRVGGPCVCVYVCKLGEDLDSLRKNTDCLASGESRQLSVLIKASQPAG